LPRLSMPPRRSFLKTGALLTFTGMLLSIGFAGAQSPSKSFTFLEMLLASGVAGAQTPPKPKPVATWNAKAAARVTRLTYQFKVGEKRRYKLSAFFVGHFPPIALEGNPPANLEADITYVMTVTKVDAKGAEVEFVAENADVYLLEKDPGPDVEVKEDDKIPVPVSLEQIQGALNVTALIQPNGTVATVNGGSNSPIKVDIGFDLRKMFLTILPVIFPNDSVKPGQAWAFDDGVLGHKPGATTYTATVDKDLPGKPNALSVTENGQTVIDNKLDKEGNSTDKVADQVGSLTGKVTAEGRILFSTTKGPTGSAVQITESRLNMVALLKRIIPDPAAPGKTSETNIDVKARLVVKPDTTVRKPAVTAGAKEKS
jgi:hypothetical protein